MKGWEGKRRQEECAGETESMQWGGDEERGEEDGDGEEGRKE